MVLGKRNDKLRVVGSMMAAGRWPMAALSIERRRLRAEGSGGCAQELLVAWGQPVTALVVGDMKESHQA